MQSRRMKVVGRSVTALAIGMALTVGSASLASASSHHGQGFRDHGVASGKWSNFDYANTGLGGFVTAVTSTSVTVALRSGSSATFTLTPTTTYTEGSAPATIAALVVGDRVRVQVSSSAATTATSVNGRTSRTLRKGDRRQWQHDYDHRSSGIQPHSRRELFNELHHGRRCWFVGGRHCGLEDSGPRNH